MLQLRRCAVVLLAVLVVVQGQSDDPTASCIKDVCVRLDEEQNLLGPSKCGSHCDCDGARLCSPAGVCNGVAVDNSTVCTNGATDGCRPGYGWTDTLDFKNQTVPVPRCALCPGGTYSAGGSPADETPCTPCGDNQASPEGSISRAACSTCPKGQAPLQFGNSPNTTCACPAGSIWNKTTCTPCPPGTRFWVSSNVTAAEALTAPTCRACTGNLISEVPDGGALTCIACDVFAKPQSSVANAKHTKCVCQPGFYGPAAPDKAGRLLCKPCSAGTYAPKADVEVCAACPNGTISAAGASKCTACKPPLLAFKGRLCVCPAGTQPDASGDKCSRCPDGLVAPKASSTCAPCPAGLVGYNGTSCVCPAGTQPDADGVACARCLLGLYKSRNSNTSCAACPEGTYPAPNATSCTKCDTKSALLADDGTSCDCRPGYTGPAVPNEKGRPACAPCPYGTYKEDTGSADCTPCPEGSVAPRASNVSSACRACPRGRVPYLGASCVCPPGLEPNQRDVCTPCKDGFVKSRASNSSCTECAEGTYANANNTLCVRCDSRSAVLAEEGGSCVCRAGYTGTPTANEKGRPACEPCAAGSFNEDGGDCVPCPSGMVAPKASNTSDACMVCPKDRVALDGASCVCAPGTEPDDAGVCVPCKQGFVKSKFSNSSCAACANGAIPNANATACVRCDNSTTVLNADGACVCAPGATGPLAINSKGRLACTLCPPGTYNTAGGAACTPCPNGGVAPEGSSSASACKVCPELLESDGESCVCALGFEPAKSNPYCTPCRPGNYKSKNSNATCVPCKDGSYTSAVGAKGCRSCDGTVNADRTACL